MIAVKVSKCYGSREDRRPGDAEPASVVLDDGPSGWTDPKPDPEIQALQRGDEMDVTEDAIFRMSHKQLDQYLDWYAETWAEDTDNICESHSMS